MSFLMWEYKGHQSGRFHTAIDAVARTAMLGKGYFDATGQQVWALPYPDGGRELPTYTLDAHVDETTSLKWHFDASPTNMPGVYDFGDGKPTAAAANGEMAHTYAAAGSYTVTFTPDDGAAPATKAITVVAAPAK